MEILFSYNFVIEHLEVKAEPADIPASRFNNNIAYERPTAWLQATLATAPVELYDHLIQDVNTAQVINVLAADVKHRTVGTPITDNFAQQLLHQHVADARNESKVTAIVLTYEGRIYIPMHDLLCFIIIRLLQDKSEFSSFGTLRTAELEYHNFHWPAMDTTIWT